VVEHQGLHPHRDGSFFEEQEGYSSNPKCRKLIIFSISIKILLVFHYSPDQSSVVDPDPVSLDYIVV
jgi:hypothetical protein